MPLLTPFIYRLCIRKLHKLITSNIIVWLNKTWQDCLPICGNRRFSLLSFVLLKKNLFLTNKFSVYFTIFNSDNIIYKRMLAHLSLFQCAEWEIFFIENTQLIYTDEYYITVLWIHFTGFLKVWKVRLKYFFQAFNTKQNLHHHKADLFFCVPLS